MLAQLIGGPGAPVTPAPDEARRLLEQELAKPEYQEQVSLLERILRWFGSHAPTGEAPLPVGWTVLGCLLLAGLAVLAWRLRDVRQVAAERRRRTAGLTDPGRSAADYRADARRELDRGAYDRAAVAAFRAHVVDLDDADVVHDAPGRTAREVAVAAAAALPAVAAEMTWAAGCFDAACYGHPDGPLPEPGEPQRVTRGDVERLLGLDVRAGAAPTTAGVGG